MCGIFGAINLEGYFDHNDHKKFVGLTDLVSYRGPDSSGYFSYDSFNEISSKSKFNIFLGHRRLSIIDLSLEGSQPLFDTPNVIVYNGEIFNYLELRDELKKLGIKFNTNTDTEVISKVYSVYGIKQFDLFNGMWAFALYDSLNKKVILSRDRFSIKPLFYLKKYSNIYFSSEIKQLLPLCNGYSLNEDIMRKFLQQGLLDINDETFFAEIKHFPARSTMAINLVSNDIEIHKYWDYSFEESINLKESIEKFKYLFTDSIRLRLRSDVEVGALLSGGLDSSSICAIASEVNPNMFKTFSIVSKHSKYSEEKFIDLTVKHNNLTNYKISFDDMDIFKHLEKVIYHQDEPVGSFGALAHFKMMDNLKKNSSITVVLSGQGGDEVLMGYLRYFFFNIKELFENKRKYIALTEIFYSLKNKTAISQFSFNTAKRYLKGRLLKDSSYLITKPELEKTWEFANLIDKQKSDIDKYSVPIMTRFEDRNSMAHSLEIRLPFLDHRLVNFLVNIPTDFKIRNGWSKYILRESMNELPKEIRWRNDKKGFITAEDKWLKNELKELIMKTFRKSKLAEMGIIDDVKFINYYTDYLKGKSNIHNFDISRVYMAEAWAQFFFS